jgi:hypothetical protein
MKIVTDDNRERMKVSCKENIDRDAREIRNSEKGTKLRKTEFKVKYIWESCGKGRRLEGLLCTIL